MLLGIASFYDVLFLISARCSFPTVLLFDVIAYTFLFGMMLNELTSWKAGTISDSLHVLSWIADVSMSRRLGTQPLRLLAVPTVGKNSSDDDSFDAFVGNY